VPLAVWVVGGIAALGLAVAGGVLLVEQGHQSSDAAELPALSTGQTGLVVIETPDGEAQVWEDGQPIGTTTPRFARRYPLHTTKHFTLKRAGCADKELSITVTDNMRPYSEILRRAK
jgi:hypothetical protein